MLFSEKVLIVFLGLLVLATGVVTYFTIDARIDMCARHYPDEKRECFWGNHTPVSTQQAP